MVEVGRDSEDALLDGFEFVLEDAWRQLGDFCVVGGLAAAHWKLYIIVKLSGDKEGGG